MRTLVAMTACLALLWGCGPANATTISAANDSALVITVLVNGTSVATISPGFSGALADLGTGTLPRTVTLKAPSGATLGESEVSRSGSEHLLDMGECGQVWLWVDGQGPSLGPATSPRTGCSLG